ncbi:MAG: broad specificity phosphatase PhoE [Maribacter sp.]|jgi:broad specificity phosphatase PhoE
MNKIIYFVRHGETDFNKKMIVQGSGVNSDLNEEGLEQGIALYEAYKHIDFELVMTSALKRTHQTARKFIEAGIFWEQYTEIDEICWGIHEGKPGNEAMKQNYKNLNASWTAGDYDARIPEGESAADLGERVARFFKVLERKKEQRILVCTHGRTLCAVSCYLESRPLKDMHLFKHKNTALTKASYTNGEFKILLKNDISHLQR